MEGPSAITLSPSPSLAAGFVGFLFIYGFLQWLLRFENFYFLILSFCQLIKVAVTCSGVEISKSHGYEYDHVSGSSSRESDDTTAAKQLISSSDDVDGGDAVMVLRRRDVEVVMEKMGILMSCDGDDQGEKEQLIIKDYCLGSDDLSVLFEEEEPSLEEVKEAFDVFDVEGDGFIDAHELQRVLCDLGFKEALSFHACQRMIRAFDTNGDDRLDFNEFVIFMESSFC